MRRQLRARRLPIMLDLTRSTIRRAGQVRWRDAIVAGCSMA